MSVSGIMYNGVIIEGLIPTTIARKTDFDSKITELEQKINTQQKKIDELEQKKNTQQLKIDELEKHMHKNLAMFELLRLRIESLEKIKKND
jgi:uncharacterized coiled-coil protein SlyX